MNQKQTKTHKGWFTKLARTRIMRAVSVYVFLVLHFMARLILFLVSITSFIVFLTVAFQNFPNDAKFFFLTDID